MRPPLHADAAIIGGGVIGSSIALHLRERLPAARIVVVERDFTYRRASSRLATGGIRQQYCSTLNVAMAQYSVAFYKSLDARTASTARPTHAWFRQRGYLFLGDAAAAAALEQRYVQMRECGARVERWSRDDIRRCVPDATLDDIALGIFGAEDGYLDPREVLAGMRALAEHAGVEFVHGEVRAIDRTLGRASGVVIDTSPGATTTDETTINASTIINAAGPCARGVAALAGIDVPIAPVRQHLFRLDLDEPLTTRIPMLFDPDGTHWRLDDPRTPGDAERLVIGRSRIDEPHGENFDVDLSRLHDEMLPTLRRRYPAARVKGVAEAWAGLYEMTPDHNGIVGEHAELPGFITAAGFSGHGLMLAPATGRAVADIVAADGAPQFDVAPLAPDRFARGALFLDGALA